jgi:hypothetical protein
VKIHRWHPPPVMLPPGEEAFFRPHVPDRLRLVENEPIFAIGSCFARNVEAFLRPRFRVPSHVPTADVPADIAALHADLTANLTLWHRYNVFSVFHSLQWALEPGAPSASHRWLDVGGGLVLDPYAGCLPPLPADGARRAGAWIDRTMATVRDCRVVVVTLGLSEVWEDSETGLVMNRAPVTEMWRAYPNRFRFRVSGCAETLAQLEALHALLSRHCAEQFRIVVTVSPIPLLATFRDLDIVVANAASKAILRAAVDAWAAERPDVHYFPSYELVLNSDQSGAWMEDRRHCTPQMIRQVMTYFLNEFTETVRSARV